MKKYILISVLFATLVIANAVSAGAVVTINDVTNINGSIGVYLKNEYYPKIFIDTTQRTASILTFYIDGIRAPVDGAHSIESLSPGGEGLVVLKSAWPEKGYQNLSIAYTDGSGISNYPHEWAAVFSKPALTVKSVETTPAKIYTNGTVTVKIRVVAGDRDIGSLNSELVTQPKYFQLSESNVPAFIKAGSEKEFVFNFNPSGQQMPETIIYSTSYVPLKLTYTYYGTSASSVMNKSFIVLNRFATRGLLPQLGLKLEMPSEIVQGSTTNISVYTWNSVLKSNKLCDLNLTLTADNSAIEIPVRTVITADPLDGRTDIPEDPAAVFLVNTKDSTPVQKYSLTVLGNYKDCDWKIPDTGSKSISFEVTPSSAKETSPPVVANNTTVVAPPVVQKNETLPEKKEEPAKKEQPPVKPPEKEGGDNILIVLIVVIVVVVVIILFAAIYLLEIRRMSIYAV